MLPASLDKLEHEDLQLPLCRTGSLARPTQDKTIEITPYPEVAVSLCELETAVAKLPADELTIFAQWFEEYLANAWDRRIEADILAGRLEEAGSRADVDFEAGRCQPL